MSIRIKLLTILTAIGVTLTWGVGSAPSQAAVTGEVEQAGQTFQVGAVQAPTAMRDAYSVTIYTPVVWPVPPSTEVSGGFGWRSHPWPEFHMGVDLTPGGGYPVRVVAAGTVSFAGCVGGGLGCHVVVEHSIDGVATQTTYGHMQYGSIFVSTGQQVTWGQQIGLVGSTGASTGNHLHFEVHVSGVPVDPYAWIVAHATGDW